MALTLTTKIPYGNACGVRVDEKSAVPRVSFTPDPHGGTEALWFCFRLEETEPDRPHPDKLELRLEHFGNLLGGGDPVAFVPVYRTGEGGWNRLKSGREQKERDGQVSVAWDVRYPEPRVDIALCFPYGPPELRQMLRKSKGYWRSDTIGVSQGGRRLVRVSNSYGDGGRKLPGIYIVARQHAGETPGSWVLDGLLQRLSAAKKDLYLVWAVPFANIDGVRNGDYGKDPFPYDINRAWGRPPMRHETLVIQRDLARWRERCRPALCLDLHAPGGSETDGLYAYLPDPEKAPDIHKQSVKWANVMKDLLSDDYAAADFLRTADYPSRWPTPSFGRFAAETLAIPSLTIETPYARIGSTVLTTKKYREAGARIANALLAK